MRYSIVSTYLFFILSPDEVYTPNHPIPKIYFRVLLYLIQLPGQCKVSFVESLPAYPLVGLSVATLCLFNDSALFLLRNLVFFHYKFHSCAGLFYLAVPPVSSPVCWYSVSQMLLNKLCSNSVKVFFFLIVSSYCLDQ